MPQKSKKRSWTTICSELRNQKNELSWVFARLIVSILAFVAASPSAAQNADRVQRMRAINQQMPSPLIINESRVSANSILKQRGNHLTLYTDVRDRADVEALVRVFDAALPQWCAYFDIDPTRAEDWHLRACIIGEETRFRNAGLMPADLPSFPAGFQRGHEMWVYFQPGNYYTRHLVLHEGTHSFMQWFLGGVGAPWYCEGMAELLGLNRWSDPTLKIGYRLKDRSEAEYWGRIKLIKDECKKENGMLLDDVFNISGFAFRDVRSYAWSWAACEFFSNHPLAKKEYAKLKKYVHLNPSQFNQQFVEAIAPVRKQLDRDWKLFIGEVEFGYDIENGVLHAATESGDNRFLIAANQSWQNTDIHLQPGDQVWVAGRGRFTVAQKNQTPWPCESNGVTIDYYRGKPLGMLVAGILGEDGTVDGLFSETAIGLKRKFEASQAGVLCLRINESPAHLSDNQGQLEVAVKIKRE